MKFDLEQEKFLKRLDLRVSTLCSVANHFEKIIIREWVLKPQDQKRWDKYIDDFHKELLENIGEIDNRIVEEFEKLEKQLKEKENGESN